MHQRHHNHQNHCIKIVPFNQAVDNQTIPNTLYCVIYMYIHTARFKEFGTLVKQSTHVSVFCHLNMFVLYNDIENICV